MKYRCKVGYESGVWLTKGKIYEDKNGSMTFDDGWTDTTWRIGLKLGYNEFSYYLEEIKDELVEEKEKIMKREFKVGDLVKGNNPTRYGITNTRMTKGEVVHTWSEGRLEVKVLEHPNRKEIGKTYSVDSEYFDLLELEPKSQSIHITVKNNQTIGVLKEDGVIVKRAVANLHPHDTFDFKVGSKIVYDRLFGVDEVEVVEDSDVEYWRCIEADGDYFTVGKVYKRYTNQEDHENPKRKFMDDNKNAQYWVLEPSEISHAKFERINVSDNTTSIQSFTDDELLSELKRRMEK